MCCYCFLVVWMHASCAGLQEGSYRHRSHASGRVPRKHGDSRFGKGDCENVTM